MKKTLLIAALLTLAMGTALAQNPGGPGQPGGGNGGNGRNVGSDNRIERMTEQLGLGEEQVIRIMAIFEASNQLRAEEQEKFRQIMSEIRDSANTDILMVLTPEQATLHAELQQQREEFRQALEDVRANRGYGGNRGKGDCGN